MKRSLNGMARLILVCSVLWLPAHAFGQVNARIIHHFMVDGTDGAQPFGAPIQGSDGMLYGTTQNRGSNDYGTVFRSRTDGSDYEVIYNFSRDPAQGQNPQATLVQGSDGRLYGTTAFSGTVFRVNTNGEDYTVLRSFGGPGILVLGRDGALYGTSMGGGTNNSGTVFKLNMDGSGFAVVCNFSTNIADARSPYPGLMEGRDGALYGTAGGGSNGLGTLFKVNLDGSDYAVLHTFGSGTDGSYPQAGLMEASNGALYGTTAGGGNNGVGTVYRLNVDGSDYAVLYHFTTGPRQGRRPASVPLIQRKDGMLYGVATEGGDASGPSAAIFRLSTNGADYAVLWSLGNSFNPDGGGPCFGLTQDRDGALYGTTLYGGTNGNGTVFQLTFLQPKFISASLLSDKTVQLSLSGVSNATYRIEASTNVVNWLFMTNILNATGTAQFKDLDAPNFVQRFYRAAWVP